MKILLFGKNGQLGWELQRSLAPLGVVVALDAGNETLCGDFSRPQGLRDTVRKVRPDVIVNAAAHTAVDRAEGEPELAWVINAQAPGVLAEEAGKIGAWMVHYSTDYVFDGSGNLPWRETDVPAPLNVYGQTKLEGEQLVAAACDKHLIFRTSWVFAARGSNFARTMLQLARHREHLAVVDDQFGAPTGADLLSDVTAHAIRQVRTRPEDAGLYHLVAAGQTSWHGYAERVIANARLSASAHEFKVKTVEPVPSETYPTTAARPRNSRLNTDHLQSVFGLELPPWQFGVDRLLVEMN